uniref:Uncharacterized protein n=1 Tax=Anguilla anguilla TaxID=7936 RepID=A0A0E9PW65_ANGAN
MYIAGTQDWCCGAGSMVETQDNLQYRLYLRVVLNKANACSWICR